MAFSDYKRVLDSNQPQTRTIYGIRSFNQQLYTTCEDKIVLTSFYDKLRMLNSIDNEPFGFVPLILTWRKDAYRYYNNER